MDEPSATTRPIHLLLFRPTKSSRAHFAIFIPNADQIHRDPKSGCKGTRIHVTGAPMAGFGHEFCRNYDPTQFRDFVDCVLLDQVDESLVTDPATENPYNEEKAIGILDREALKIDPPRVSKNFLAPVNDTTNRRCQEWTMDYLRALVKKEFLPRDAVDVAQSFRDPPDFGIGLKGVAEKSTKGSSAVDDAKSTQ